MDNIYQKYVDRRHRKSRKARAPQFYRCFYTGMVLQKKVDPFSGYTIEHLIPKMLIKTIPQTTAKMIFDKAQRVPAVSIINHLIGHAPLRVKFDLRDFLSNNRADSSLSEDEQLEHYAHMTRLFLERFKTPVDGIVINHMPWYYKSLYNPEHAQILFQKYYALLTTEERILLAIKNKDINYG